MNQPYAYRFNRPKYSGVVQGVNMGDQNRATDTEGGGLQRAISEPSPDRRAHHMPRDRGDQFGVRRAMGIPEQGDNYSAMSRSMRRSGGSRPGMPGMNGYGGTYGGSGMGTRAGMVRPGESVGIPPGRQAPLPPSLSQMGTYGNPGPGNIGSLPGGQGDFVMTPFGPARRPAPGGQPPLSQMGTYANPGPGNIGSLPGGQPSLSQMGTFANPGPIGGIGGGQPSLSGQGTYGSRGPIGGIGGGTIPPDTRRQLLQMLQQRGGMQPKQAYQTTEINPYAPKPTPIAYQPYQPPQEQQFNPYGSIPPSYAYNIPGG